MRLISKGKIKAILEKLEQLKVDAAVFVNMEPLIDSNIAYLSGFSGMLNGILVLRKEGTHLLTTALDYERALEEASVDEVVKISGKERAKDAVKPLLSKARRIGVVKDRFTLGAMGKLKIPESKLVDIEKIMREERSVKEEKEIGAVKKSAWISNTGVKFLQDFIRKGVRENEVAAELERCLRASGSERTPFDIIVTSGYRSSIVHPYPSASSKKIGPGLGLVDFGAVYRGYVTDVTVPFLVGNGNKKTEKVVDTVMSAFDVIVKKIKDGVSAAKISKAYENSIKSGGFQVKHSLGHGIGLDTHDSPSFTEADSVLVKNMTLAVEPGAYVKGFGGCRIENDLIVKKSGCEMLTKSKLIRI
jgi:Xaa-Pro aminopeptidase